MCVSVCVYHVLSCVQGLANPWTIAHSCWGLKILGVAKLDAPTMVSLEILSQALAGAMVSFEDELTKGEGLPSQAHSHGGC